MCCAGYGLRRRWRHGRWMDAGESTLQCKAFQVCWKQPNSEGTGTELGVLDDIHNETTLEFVRMLIDTLLPQNEEYVFLSSGRVGTIPFINILAFTPLPKLLLIYK